MFITLVISVFLFLINVNIKWHRLPFLWPLATKLDALPLCTVSRIREVNPKLTAAKTGILGVTKSPLQRLNKACFPAPCRLNSTSLWRWAAGRTSLFVVQQAWETTSINFSSSYKLFVSTFRKQFLNPCSQGLGGNVYCRPLLSAA